MKRLKFPLLTLVLSLFIYTLTELRHGLFSRPFQARNFLLILLVSGCCVWLHLKRSQDVPRYAVRLLGGVSSPGRIIYLDCIRVLAAVLVIAVHVLESTYSLLPAHSPAWEILAVLASLSLCCNLLFMMLSGALILNGKEEPVWVFYQKRLARVLIPCFCYYLFYLFYAYGFSVFYPPNWGNLIRGFISNGSGLTPHFWLVYVILMFYLTAPFFRIMMKHLSDRMLASLILVIFILHAAFTYLPFLNISFAASTFLASWESIFLLGYFCTRDLADRYYKLINACGILSVLGMIAAVHFMDDFGAVLYNNAPPMMFLSCSVFLFFKRHAKTLFRKVPAVFSCIGHYSYSILLIHWLVLYEFVYKTLGLSGLDFGIAGGVLLCILTTLALSLAFAVFYDNTIVLCLDAVFQKLTGRFMTGAADKGNGSGKAPRI